VLTRVHALKPRVELVFEIQVVGEHATGLEVGLQEALQSLDGTLGLWIASPAEVPADAQLPAERGELHGRAAVVAVNAGLAVPDQRFGQPAELPQTASDPAQQICGLLAEDQRAGTRARVAQARDDDPWSSPAFVDT